MGRYADWQIEDGMYVDKEVMMAEEVKTAPTAAKKPTTAKKPQVPVKAPTATKVAPEVTAAAVAQVTKPAPPAFKIGAPTRDRWLKMMVYGPYGAGKTWLSATAREVEAMKDILLIDAEAGTLTIAGWPIDVISINSFDQFARVHEYLRLHCRFRDGKNVEKQKELEAKYRGVALDKIKTPRQYRTVIVDSLTEVQKYCMYQLLGIKVGEVALDVESPRPEWAEWGKSSEMMRLLVRSFRDLPMHVIFVCAEQRQQDETGRYHYLPALPGKLAGEVQGFLDVVAYLRSSLPTEKSDQVRRRLFIQPGATYDAKDRYHAGAMALPYIDEPTIAKFIETEGGER